MNDVEEYPDAYANTPFGIEQGNDHAGENSELRTHHGIEFLDDIEDRVEHFVESFTGEKHHDNKPTFKGVESQPHAIWTREAQADGIRFRTYVLQANIPIQIADKATQRKKLTVTLLTAGANPVYLSNNTGGLVVAAPNAIAIGGVNLSRIIEAKCDLWAVAGVAAVTIDVIEEYFTNQSL